MNAIALRRGDIVIAADRLGEFSGKPRPFVLLQTPLLPDEAAPLPVAAITTTFRDAPLLRISLPADSTTGLAAPSWVAVDLITTIRRHGLRQRIGRVDPAAMAAIGRALLVYLGFAGGVAA